MADYELVVEKCARLGEGPLWVAREQALYWVDLADYKICRFDPATGVNQWFETPTQVTALGMRESGGFVVSTVGGFAFWNSERPGELEAIADIVGDQPAIRFNDGKVDPRGSFWAGTMNDDDPDRPDGSLFRLDPSGAVHCMGSGYTVSNGIGWSLDHRTMYYTDTNRQTIYAFDYDIATGAIENQRPFVVVPPPEGKPDGMTVDSEGFIWSAHWNGWKVVRYDPDGKPEREIKLPVAQVSCPAFGGADLDQLYLTTARKRFTEDDLREQPLAGGLFRVDPGAKGLSENYFKG
jgi:sugar lactone lactonase YvrE